MVRLPIKTLLGIDGVDAVDAHFSSQYPQVIQFRQGQDCSHDALEALSHQLEAFLVEQFGIHTSYEALQQQLKTWDSLVYFYENITKPAILKREDYTAEDISAVWDSITEEEVASISKLLSVFPKKILMAWAQVVWQTQQKPYVDWQIFSLPKRIDFNQLVTIESIKPRVDYQYIGATISTAKVMHQANYCIECHEKNNDSCSTGFVVRKTGDYKINPLGRVLMGCPLNQKISQMHRLRKQHRVIAALAMTMIDNPLCLVTGDRVCNDCMVACIYQKVDPVDTPSVESDTLKQVLSLPYGAEIYLLLARWNPLKRTHYKYQPQQLGRVAVIGMGPSGFAMSYYLLMAGCQVMGFDGLPIRDYDDDVNLPIKDFDQWAKTFNQGKPLAFGGVIDYGITVRWDKRLILLVWVLLNRFPRFSIWGNIRLGGVLTIEALKEVGFDQVVLATGAGLPQAHAIQNKPGIHFANEFLMRLQISGMLHHTLQTGIQLPVVVIGGGLTAIDTATEAQVYYIKWVEQVVFWHSVMGDALFVDIDKTQRAVVDIWLAHGKKIQQCRREKGDLAACIKDLGGVHIAYRRTMQESPAYRINALEIEKALEQGIIYHEKLSPLRAIESSGQVSELICDKDGVEVKMPAKTVFIATGSKPNVAYFYERRQPLSIENGYYRRTDAFTADAEGFPDYITIVGDLHPKYHGSVVGALASAKDSYEMILSRLESKPQITKETIEDRFVIQLMGVRPVNKTLLGLTLKSGADLPIGAYIKITVEDEVGILQQVKAVIVKPNEAWVEKDAEGVQYLDKRLFGILGPSGTRLVSKSSTDIVVVCDRWGIKWAVAIASSAKQAGKKAIVYPLEPLPLLTEYFDEVLEHMPSDAFDTYYCVSADKLATYQQRNQSKKAFAIVDGPMMCMLKGICGQCIQWQIEEGKPIKAVYSCSWQNQPLTLIDVEHLLVRQNESRIEKQLYKKWQAFKENEI